MWGGGGYSHFTTFAEFQSDTEYFILFTCLVLLERSIHVLNTYGFRNPENAKTLTIYVDVLYNRRNAEETQTLTQ